MIAFERGDERIAFILKNALALGLRIFVPASALGQVWRGGPTSARLSRLLAAGEVDPLDEARAKEIGVRLGLRKQSDVADGHVVCCALANRATVATSDGGDIQALAGPGERLRSIAT